MVFIVFEGIDGAGKSTQALLLADKLKKNNFEVVLTSEPTQGPLGQKIRRLKTRLTPQEEMELFTEDRKDHVRDVIIPATQAGKIVVCDRYFYSSAAYQGALGLDPLAILQTNLEFAPKPDITFFLDLSIENAVQRIIQNRGARLSPYETRDNLGKVMEIYSVIRDSSFVNVNAECDVRTIHCTVWNRLRDLMK